MSLSFKKIFWVFVFVSALGIGEVRAQVNTCPPLGSCDSILQQGMRLEAGQGVGVQAPMLVQGNISSQAVCDVFSNTLSSVTGNNYFVPTRTIGEYNSLRAATDGGFVQGVSYVPCGCGDGICMGPPVEDCGPDDSGDPNVRGNPSCASDCGTVCPPICGDGYCPDPQNSPIEHCAAVGNNIIPESNAD